MGVLTKEEIKKLLKDKELVITPILDLEAQLGRASFDTRLGNEFIIMKKVKTAGLDIKSRDLIRQRISEYQDKVLIPPFSKTGLVIHPGQIVLACTLEFFKFPSDLTAQVIGRSSWGRLGLIVATATFVDPGFKGVIILELINAGDVPISLYPGIRIAQLILYKGSATESYHGKYILQTRTVFSKIYEEKETQIFTD